MTKRDLFQNEHRNERFSANEEEEEEEGERKFFDRWAHQRGWRSRDNYLSCRAQITGNAPRNSRVCTRVTRYNLRCGVHNQKQNPGWPERMALVRLAATVFYQEASHTGTCAIGTTAIHVSNLSPTIFREILTRLRVVVVVVVVSSGATCETIDVSCIIHRGSPFDPRPVLRFPCFQISSQFHDRYLLNRLRKNLFINRSN